jgi:pimeloyl-ACP methyl ester carboxylesterase
VHWEIADPGVVWARHGHRATGEAPAYPAPEVPKIDVSGVVGTARSRQYWLRFPSPVLGDTAWAHVYEPAAAPARATMIFLHGIAVDGDMWPEAGDTFAALLDRGIRIIRPTGPWHGRRMLKGYYGGEPIIARGLLGMLDAFQAALAETAVLTRWAREGGSDTVILSGVSLGSLTAQLAATACRDWPAAMRPDVLFLIATSGSMTDVAFTGSLAKSLGIPRRLAEAGWTEEALDPWLALLEPHGEAVMAPERILMVLGEADDLTPFAGGSALARRWRIPAENLFLRPQGHFSVALGLLCDPAPIDRLLAVIGRTGA